MNYYSYTLFSVLISTGMIQERVAQAELLDLTVYESPGCILALHGATTVPQHSCHSPKHVFKATHSPRNLIPLTVCPAPLKDQSNWLPQWTLLWSLCYSNTRIWYSKCVKPGMNWSMTWTQGCHHSQAIPGFIHCALGSTPSLSGKMPWGLGPLQP